MSQASQPIGIFDSGLGGLTIVKAVHKLMPDEPVVYFGDTAHLPYGDKSPELIQEYAGNITRFLKERKVKAVVIACNTASAVAREAVIEHAGDIPVFDVVGPAVREALRRSRAKNIGVIGTKATISSGIYQRTINSIEPSARVVEKATPLLVPLIEEGWLHNTISREVVEAYMSDTGFFNIDTLILGCTHYPLVKDEIGSYFKSNFSLPVEIVDSSLTVAGEVREFLKNNKLLHQGASIDSSYSVSDYSQNFEDSAKLFLERAVQFQKIILH